MKNILVFLVLISCDYPNKLSKRVQISETVSFSQQGMKKVEFLKDGELFVFQNDTLKITCQNPELMSCQVQVFVKNSLGNFEHKMTLSKANFEVCDFEETIQQEAVLHLPITAFDSDKILFSFSYSIPNTDIGTQVNFRYDFHKETGKVLCEYYDEP